MLRLRDDLVRELSVQYQNEKRRLDKRVAQLENEREQFQFKYTLKEEEATILQSDLANERSKYP
jgi:hypothetical protein